MGMIEQQVNYLRVISSIMKDNDWKNAVNQAADTIETLSAKLAAVNAERNEILKGIRKKAQELSNQHWGDDERHLIGKGIQCMCVQAENIISTYEDSAANMERSDRCYGDLVSAGKLIEELRLKEFSLEICRGSGDVSKTPKMVFMKDIEDIIDGLRS